MWTDALTGEQSYKVSKERSDQRINTRRDAVALKEETAACHSAKVEGNLDLVEEARVALEALSDPVDVETLRVDYLEVLIRSKGQIPEKGPNEVQLDQLKKLLDAYPFHLFSPYIQIKYYNN